MLLQDPHHLRHPGEVVPLVGVGPHVVQLLGAVGVADVAPVLRPHPVVVVVVGGDGGTFARGRGVFQLRHQAHALEVVARRQSAQIDERVVHVDEPDGLVAILAFIAAGQGDLGDQVLAAVQQQPVPPFLANGQKARFCSSSLAWATLASITPWTGPATRSMPWAN